MKVHTTHGRFPSRPSSAISQITLICLKNGDLLNTDWVYSGHQHWTGRHWPCSWDFTL